MIVFSVTFEVFGSMLLLNDHDPASVNMANPNPETCQQVDDPHEAHTEFEEVGKVADHVFARDVVVLQSLDHFCHLL